MDSRSEASERYLNERREYWRRIKIEEEKYSKVHSPKNAVAPQKSQERLSNSQSSAPVRKTVVDSVASKRFLNERREYWKQIVKREGKAPRLEVKKEEAKAENTEDPNSLSAWQIVLLVIVGGLLGWLLAEAGNLILLFALFIGALFLKCLR